MAFAAVLGASKQKRFLVCDCTCKYDNWTQASRARSGRRGGLGFGELKAKTGDFTVRCFVTIWGQARRGRLDGPGDRPAAAMGARPARSDRRSTARKGFRIGSSIDDLHVAITPGNDIHSLNIHLNRSSFSMPATSTNLHRSKPFPVHHWAIDELIYMGDLLTAVQVRIETIERIVLGLIRSRRSNAKAAHSLSTVDTRCFDCHCQG